MLEKVLMRGDPVERQLALRWLGDPSVMARTSGQALRSLVPLLRDPAAAWERPAITNYRFGNHTVRTAGWRYIRYADGGEELYDATADPNEWVNLAARPEFAARKAELAAHLPRVNVPTPPEKGAASKPKGNGRR